MGELFSEIIGTAGLALAAAAAAALTWLRRPKFDCVEARGRTAALFGVGICVQALHAGEEFSTRFYERFPAALGLQAWPVGFFVLFNAFWLAIWIAAAFGLKSGRRLAFFPVWFFAIVAVANGIAHPLLAWRAGGYFPGLLTSPLLGVVGVWLWSRLTAITEPEHHRVEWRTAVRFVEAVLFTIVVPGSVVYWIPRDLLGIWGVVLPPGEWKTWHWIAIVPLTVGLMVYLSCVREFALRGRGIPAPLDHPKQLVATGLYRYVRNPMYVGVLLFLLGESMFFELRPFLVYTAGWLLFVHLNVLFYEEPNLRRKFGDSYERYRAEVHRWIPRFRLPAPPRG